MTENISNRETSQGPSRLNYLWATLLITGMLALALGSVFIDRQIGQAAAANSLRVAFMSDRDGNWDIYLMDGDGKNVTQLTRDPADEGLPLHVAGQDKLFFMSNSNTAGMDAFAVDLNGKNPVKITDTPNSNNSVISGSPDGKYVVINSDKNGGSEYFLLDLYSGEENNLTERDDVARFDGWSAQGDRYLASSASPNGVQLFSNTIAGDDKQTLTDGSYPVAGPQWSPDGTKIAAMAVTAENEPINIYMIDTVSGELTNLTQSQGNNSFPYWSPDGRKIAFVSDRDGDAEIYVMDADGGNQTNLTQDASNDAVQGDLSWSPDGSQILFHTDRDGDVEIYLMNADGSNLVNLTKSPSSDFGAVWVE